MRSRNEEIGWFVAVVQRQVVASNKITASIDDLFVIAYESAEHQTRPLTALAYMYLASKDQADDVDWDGAPAGSWCLLTAAEEEDPEKEEG